MGWRERRRERNTSDVPDWLLAEIPPRADREPDSPPVASGRGSRSVAHLVIGPNGQLTAFWPQFEDLAIAHARTVGGLMVALPVLYDYTRSLPT